MNSVRFFSILLSLCVITITTQANVTEPLPVNIFTGDLSGTSYMISTEGITFRQERMHADTQPVYEVGIKWQHASDDVEVFTVDKNGNYMAVSTQTAPTAHIDKIVFQNLYFNIDLVVYPPARTEKSMHTPAMRYEFVVYPGGNAADISLLHTGNQRRQLLEDGSMMVHAPFGTFSMTTPFAWQDDARTGQSTVAAEYSLQGNKLNMATGPYEQAQVMTITYDQSISIPAATGQIGGELHSDVATQD